jgi:hypothetical protein
MKDPSKFLVTEKKSLGLNVVSYFNIPYDVCLLHDDSILVKIYLILGCLHSSSFQSYTNVSNNKDADDKIFKA